MSGVPRRRGNGIFRGIGLGRIMGKALPFVVIPIFVLLIDMFFIRAEEAVLETAFGTEYLAYKARVRRWI